MQQQYVDQINNMKASQEAFKDQVQTRAKKSNSTHSERKPTSQKDFKEDTVNESELNERVDEVLIGASYTDRKDPSVERVMMRDASAQAFDSAKNMGSILKTTGKSRGVGYHSTVIDNSVLRESSNGRSEDFGLNGTPKARNKSFKSIHSSFASNKSFRIPQGRYAMSRDDAATIIQKRYRGYRARQDYKLMRRKDT